jgi:hypothetical protein
LGWVVLQCCIGGVLMGERQQMARVRIVGLGGWQKGIAYQMILYARNPGCIPVYDWVFAQCFWHERESTTRASVVKCQAMGRFRRSSQL